MKSERDLIKVIQELNNSGIRVLISGSFADNGFFYSFRVNPQDEFKFDSVAGAEDLADAIHLKALALFPQSQYASRNASEYLDDYGKKLPELSIPTEGSDMERPVQVQILTGQPACRVGNIAMVLLNAPIANVRLAETGEEVLAPAIQMPARQAMEVAMNIIHLSKLTEISCQREEG